MGDTRGNGGDCSVLEEIGSVSVHLQVRLTGSNGTPQPLDIVILHQMESQISR
jgi:hypothetical protein